MLQAQDAGSDIPAENAIELHYRLAECPHCGTVALSESGQAYNGKYWVPLKAIARVEQFDRTRAPEPRAAEPPVVAGPRTFGRRTTAI